MNENKKLIVTLDVAEFVALIEDSLESKLQELKQAISTTAVEPKKKELPKLITRHDIAQLFGISLVSVDKWRKWGLLPKSIKQSGRTYFLRADVEKLLEDKMALARIGKSINQ